MTIFGSYLAIGSVSWVHCLLATSSWKSMYSPSLSWTHLFLRKDQPLIASKQRWCSSLQKRCPSNSISSCGAALDPSPAVSFLALLVRRFFVAIACNDTSVKVSLHEIRNHYFSYPKQARSHSTLGVFFSVFLLIACVIVQLIIQITTQSVLFWKKLTFYNNLGAMCLSWCSKFNQQLD